MLGALARIVHHRQRAPGYENDCAKDDQYRGLHGDLATAGPQTSPSPDLMPAKMNRM
jgi:hypothetical protein